MPSYNGHRSWNCWNVALWLDDDEGLYRLCIDVIRSTKSRHRAAKIILKSLARDGITRTPDGARYNQTAIYHAIEEM